VSFSALLELAVTLMANVPVVVAFTTQLTPLNAPMPTCVISCVLFATVHSCGAFSVTLTSFAACMNEFSVAFITNGRSWNVSFGVVTVSTSIFAAHPGNSIVMFSLGDSLWL